MGYVAGVDLKTYYNSGAFGSPTWVLLGDVGDAKLGVEKETQDASVRGAGGWGYDVGKLMKLTYSFDSVYDPLDTGYAYLQTAFLANTDTEFAFADGPIATDGTVYLRALCGINKADGEDPLTGARKTNWTLQPTYSANAPSLTTVSS